MMLFIPLRLSNSHALPIADEDRVQRRKIALYRISRGLFVKFRVSLSKPSLCFTGSGPRSFSFPLLQQSIMTPYMKVLAPLTDEVLSNFVEKPNSEIELWKAVISTLTTSYSVDDNGKWMQTRSPGRLNDVKAHHMSCSHHS